jgi:hypothetical protein
MNKARKISVKAPGELLRETQESLPEQGATATIRRGLELAAASQAYEELLWLKGKVNFSVDWRELREDRT